jgi:tetratricopeptide (TPR) repeat protein
MRALANIRKDFGKVDEALVLFGETLRLQDLERSEDHATHVKKVFPVENVAGLLSDMGEAYHSKGQLDVAMSHYRQALDKVTMASTSLPTSGSAAMELANIYSYIGQANHEKGDLEQAEEYYRKALRVQQRALRENHPSIVETLIHLARLQRDSGASEDSALAALAKAEMLLKGRENHREFARLLMLKADLLRKAERLTEAEAAALRALEIQESLGSEGTPELAVGLNIVGMILHDQNKFQHAEEQYMRALETNVKTVGSRHPETANTYNNLGYLYQDLGNDDEAETYYRKSAEIQKAIYSDETPDVAATYNNIATILVHQGRFTEAEELLTTVVNIVRKAGMPPGSTERAVYEQNLEQVRHELAGTTQEDASPTCLSRDCRL